MFFMEYRIILFMGKTACISHHPQFLVLLRVHVKHENPAKKKTQRCILLQFVERMLPVLYTVV